MSESDKKRKPRKPVENKLQKIPRIKGDEAPFTPMACSFQQFFAVWAALEKWDIPDFHFNILSFLSNYRSWDSNTGLVQIFRGAGKSTIVGLFIVWLLTQDPTLRFLVLSADKKTAMKVTLHFATIIERHPLAQHLRGEEGAWRADTLVVKGATDGRNPSITSWGVGSNITGARADWIIYDDTEVAKNSGTEGERENLRARLDEPTHILVPGGYELFIGTPHSFDSIYTELEGSSGKEEPFRTGCSALKIPIMEDAQGEFPAMTGTPTWPERFPLPEIEKRQRGSLTKGHFLSQYLLLPYNPEDTVLDPNLVATYSGEIEVMQANGNTLVRLNGTRVMGVTAFWDPSLAKLSTDDSVLAIVYTTDDGHYYVHRAVKLQGDAEEQARHVISVMQECEAPHLLIETNGVGGFLPPIFRKVAEGKGITCDGRYTTQNKTEKILHAYEARLSSGYIHAHKSVMDSPFRTQLRDFNGRAKGKDDFIDAVAMAILTQPIRIRSGTYGRRSAVWQSGALGGGYEIEMEPVSF